MDNDLISRSQACEMLLKQQQLTPSVVRRVLLQVPTVDAVEVVRCKDCDHKHAVTCEGIILCTYHGKMIQMHRSDFCSYGERKEGADND